MTSVVTQIDGIRLTRSVVDGNRGQVVYVVKGLTGSTPLARAFEAQTAPGIPQFGDTDPGAPGMFVTEVNTENIGSSRTTMRVIVNYQPPIYLNLPPSETSQGTIHVGVTTVEKQTRFDFEGNQITLQHTFYDQQADGTLVPRTEQQAGTVTVQIPVMVLGMTRKEGSSPANKARNYGSRMNTFPIWNEDARKWLCTRLEGTSDDGGFTYNVVYEFTRAPPGDTWDAEVVFIADDGNPPIGLVDGEGRKIVQVIGEANFSELNLDLL